MPPEGWPPKPVTNEPLEPVTSECLPGLPTDVEAEEAVQIAVHNERIRVLLGEPFVHLGTDPVMQTGMPFAASQKPNFNASCMIRGS